MLKKYDYISPVQAKMEEMIDNSIDDFDEIDESIKNRTLNAYSYDCFDSAAPFGSYFTPPDCMVGENT